MKFFPLLTVTTVLLQSTLALAEVSFSARLDRDEIAEDESVSLKLSLESEGIARLQGDPRYSAPDFELVSEYPSQNFETVYDNGRFSMKSTMTYTYVLRPKRRGNFKIDGIEVVAEGATYRAPALPIRVVAGGGGTPPPRGYGGGVGLRGAAKRPAQQGVGFFVRAEVDKAQAYKGERLVVSYYLYTRVRVYNVKGEKYPALSGFLREELEMPIVQPNTGSRPDQVVLAGVPYERILLVRYAAYPLREGKLPLDPIGVQVDYFSQGSSGVFDEDDPFAGFFNQMMPRKGSSSSETLTVDVLPLPTEGKPANFTGGIGQFEAVAGVDRAEVKTGEPLTFSIKVEGQGNLTSFDAPKPQWPEGVRVYEATSRITGGKSGAGQKTFDYVLVFRKPGDAVLPPVEFSHFDPVQKKYVTLTTSQQRVSVTGALLEDGTERQEKPAGDTAASAPLTPEALVAQLAQPLDPTLIHPGFLDRARGWLSIAVGPARVVGVAMGFASILAGLISLIGRIRRGSRKRSASAAVDPKRAWNKAEAELKHWVDGSGSADRGTLEATLLQARTVLEDALERVYGLNPRVYSIQEFLRLLREEKGMSNSDLEPVEGALRGLQDLLYAARRDGDAGAASAEPAIRSLLKSWTALGARTPELARAASGGDLKLLEDADEAAILRSDG